METEIRHSGAFHRAADGSRLGAARGAATATIAAARAQWADDSDAQIGAALDPWLAGLSRGHVFNGAVLVARNGREIYAAAYGDASLEPRTALNVETRFPLASITKQFTQASVLQLIEAGRLCWETTIGDVIPDYPNAMSRSATVQQLMDHRGGLADFLGPGSAMRPKKRSPRTTPILSLHRSSRRTSHRVTSRNTATLATLCWAKSSNASPAHRTKATSPNMCSRRRA